MFDIVHRIGIKATPASVYQALATTEGVSHWWTDDVSGQSAVGANIAFAFRLPSGELKGSMVMRVTDLSDASRVEWECVEGPPEWVGTRISYDLAFEDDQTIVRFAHRGWKEEVDFAAHCSMKWAVFLLSLRDYVQAGKGQPSPRDVKIDNWN
jgi:uncharacterized protein YndB with AHSA1/START domain